MNTRMYAIKYKGKYGLIDRNGTVVVPARFDYALSDSWDYGVLRTGSREVIVSSNGTELASIECDDMSRFRHGLACVEIGGKYGYCNASGEMVVAAVYDYGRPHTELGAVVKRNGTWGLIDAGGNLIQESRDGQVDYVFSESEGLFAAQQGEKWGYLDRNFRWAIPPEYGHGNPFSEGVASVWNPGCWAFIDKLGRQVTGFDFARAQNYGCGLCAVRRDDVSGICYIDAKRKVVSGEYTAGRDFVEGVTSVYVGGKVDIHNCAVGGRWIVVDTSFRTIYDKRLTGAEPLSGGLVRIYTGATDIFQARMGYIDHKGNVVWEPSR